MLKKITKKLDPMVVEFNIVETKDCEFKIAE